jgi:uncharacterized protein YecE (DUF72 family)
MAKHVIVGCAGLPHGMGWPRYFLRLPYLETGALLHGPVRPSVLRRWRESARHGRAFGVVAPAIITHTPPKQGYGQRGWLVPPERFAEAGGFRDSPLVEHGVAELQTALTTLDAAAAVFRTPPDFSPSQSNRDAMRRFFGERATAERFEGRARVWVPSGLWDPPVAHAFAKELGILCGLDPLGSDPERRFAPFWDELVGDDAYLVISGMGRSRRRTSNDDLELVAEVASRHDRAWVVFATVDPFPDAIRFAKLVGTSSADLDDGEDADADDGELQEEGDGGDG